MKHQLVSKEEITCHNDYDGIYFSFAKITMSSIYFSDFFSIHLLISNFYKTQNSN